MRRRLVYRSGRLIVQHRSDRADVVSIIATLSLPALDQPGAERLAAAPGLCTEAARDHNDWRVRIRIEFRALAHIRADYRPVTLAGALDRARRYVAGLPAGVRKGSTP
ncbi:MAG: hypothetical protein CMO30_15180 [Tistrella sp.]|uniref:hypothetical protein n=1 Tax=Tistrella sp. TaxID=2024861 RepID=UPI000C45B079|nr:hypothetical protein [Tistrella sp.]MAD38570.1 hypothetical protein [Tistrella sp.]MBA75348.1 hypothetical protein [Tistrella sp.]MBA76611.1 hypothetical protein [Tistrella sp.]